MLKVSPQEAWQRIRNQQARLIDVRTPHEYQTLRAAGAENHELSTLTGDYIAEHILPGSADKPLLVICKSGFRASQAAELFKAMNVKQVLVVDGGTDLWNEQGLPVEKGGTR